MPQTSLPSLALLTVSLSLLLVRMIHDVFNHSTQSPTVIKLAIHLVPSRFRLFVLWDWLRIGIKSLSKESYKQK